MVTLTQSRAAMPTRYDEAAFPLLRIHATGDSSDEDVHERLAFLERQLDRREKIVVVFDTTGSRPISARQRKMWTDWLSKEDPRIRRYLMGVSIVVTSTVVRGVFTGVFWVWRPPMPYTFTASVGEAEAWAHRQLASHSRR